MCQSVSIIEQLNPSQVDRRKLNEQNFIKGAHVISKYI